MGKFAENLNLGKRVRPPRHAVSGAWSNCNKEVEVAVVYSVLHLSWYCDPPSNNVEDPWIKEF